MPGREEEDWDRDKEPMGGDRKGMTGTGVGAGAGMSTGWMG